MGYGDPIPDIEPPCDHYGWEHVCMAPWGHSKGVLAWNDDGRGFVMQVSTPSWPGNGDASNPRKEQGNTLGCIEDDNAKVSQHFFSLRLASTDDTKVVLQALQRASVATDPKNIQLMKLSSNGPEELSTLAHQLGHVDESKSLYVGTLSVHSVQVVVKPFALAVPPWHLVSSVLEKSLRVASWWAAPRINSSQSDQKPGCWDDSLKIPKEVQTALTGKWGGKVFGLQGESSTNGNHAKVGHSIGGSLSIFGDMNQQGNYNLNDSWGGCNASQAGRGGLFFVVDDKALHSGIQALLEGDSAPYYKVPAHVATDFVA